jgi:hypothetical protein
VLPAEVKPVRYEAAQLSYAEAARLARARESAGEALVEAYDGIREAVARLDRARHRVGVALNRLSSLVSERRLGRAGEAFRRVLDEHAGDGAEDRRTRPVWQSAPVVWGLILICAVYDTFFFATTFQVALDTPADAPWWEKAVAYVPGLGIAMALIVAGTLIGKPLFRHRSRAERRSERGPLNWRIVLARTFREWRPGKDRREAGDLPWPSWPLPVSFLLLVLAVLGVWAWLRGNDLRDQSLRWPLVALLLLLTIAAVLLKAIAENPFADHWALSRKRLEAVRRTARLREKEVRREITGLTDSWYRLQAVTEQATAAARRELIDAWIEIAESREQHQRTGPISPAFAQPGATDRVTVTFFDGVDGPPMRALVLDQAWKALEEAAPMQFSDRLDELLEMMDRQLEAAMRTATG